jgi:ABC-2 type transport system permease protein
LEAAELRTDFVTVYWRDMKKFFRSKYVLITSLIQPALWLAIYGLSMSGSFDLVNAGTPLRQGFLSVNYLTFMAAGVVSLTILFTCLYSGTYVQFDIQFGLMKEMVASPIKRSHILLGLSLSGLTKALIQTTIILGFGLILGVKYFAGFTILQMMLSVLGILLFIVLFSMGLMFLALTLGITIEGHDSIQSVITLLTLPLFFASNALYQMNSLPTAIQVASSFNPLSYFINGIRYFSIGPKFYSMGTYYEFGTTDMLVSLAVLSTFTIAMYLLAMRAIKRVKMV